MGRITILEGENLTLTTAVNVLAALQSAAAAAAAANVRVKRFELSQNATTTLAMVRGHFATRTTAGTLTVTSLAPMNVRPLGGPASGLAGSTAPAGGAARSGVNGTVDSGGTYTEILPFNFANTAGYLYKPAPDEEIIIPPSTLFVARFKADPSNLAGWTFSLVLEED